MSNLDLNVNVSIALNSLAVQRASFGMPVLCDYFPTTIWADLTRTYRASTALTALVADGFAATDPIVKMATALLGADIQVEEFKVGRLETAYTQTIGFTTTSSTEGSIVGLTIEKAGVEYESYHTVLGEATPTTVAAALKVLIDAHDLDITVTPTIGVLAIVADNAGDLFHYSVTKNGTLLDNTAAASLAADLTAIETEDDAWYGLLLAMNSKAAIVAASGWIETRRKIFGTQNNDLEVITSSTTDIGYVLNAASRARTELIYSNPRGADSPSNYAACAWFGKAFPKDAGAQTWAFKTLSGVMPSVYTATEQGYLDSKVVNSYITMGGVNVTRMGNMSLGATSFIDQVRLRDWLETRIQENIFNVMIANDKVPYDDEGIDLLRAAIKSAYDQGARSGALTLESWSFQALAAADQTSSDRLNRIVRDIQFGGKFTNAIHTVYVTGNISA